MVSCGLPKVDFYVTYISEAEFKTYTKRQCKNLAIKSRHKMLQTTSLCDCYTEFEDRLLLVSTKTERKAKDTIQPISLRAIHVTESKNNGRL